MSWIRISRKVNWQLGGACVVLVLIAIGAVLYTRSEYLTKASQYEADDPDAPLAQPAELEQIAGTDFKRVTLSAEGADRIGLQTAPIIQKGVQTIIPYAAVLYDPEGNAFTYTSPEWLSFVRQNIKIDRVDGDRVLLSEGPPAGTEVATVGAEEVYGTEMEVAGE